jgi:hypothetical protein
LDQINLPGGDRHADRQIDARYRGENIRKNAIAAGKTRDVVKQDRLVADFALIDVDDTADFLLQLGAADLLELIGGFHLCDPLAQVLFCHFCFPVHGGG